jgi:hypothetical protein
VALPAWFASLTNAANFADPTKNGGLPTFGDALQGIGSSMKQHYLQNFAPTGGALPPSGFGFLNPGQSGQLTPPAAPAFPAVPAHLIAPQTQQSIDSMAAGQQKPWGSGPLPTEILKLLVR